MSVLTFTKVESLRARELFVVLEDCVQVGPEDWEARKRVMHVTPETTVGQVADWMGEQVGANRGAQNATLVFEAQTKEQTP